MCSSPFMKIYEKNSNTFNSSILLLPSPTAVDDASLVAKTDGHGSWLLTKHQCSKDDKLNQKIFGWKHAIGACWQSPCPKPGSTRLLQSAWSGESLAVSCGQPFHQKIKQSIFLMHHRHAFYVPLHCFGSFSQCSVLHNVHDLRRSSLHTQHTKVCKTFLTFSFGYYGIAVPTLTSPVDRWCPPF